MRQHGIFALVAVSGLLLACPAHQRGSTLGAGDAPAVSNVELAELQVPPTPQSLAVFRKLRALADQGDAHATWQRAHYLMDLFDAARFAEDAASRDFLGNIAGRPADAMRGPAATQAIAELVILEIDHVLEIDRNHALAGQARTLLGFDASPPAERVESFQSAQELKRIVDQDSALAQSARLRLFGYCRAALEDAYALNGPARRIAVSHCLYPLYRSDPEPYFHADPAQRPPAPSASVLLQKAEELLVGAKRGRLRAAFAAQRQWANAFADKANAMRPLDPIALHLPPAYDARPEDDYPRVPIGDSSVEVRSDSLRGELVADGRGMAALVLPSEASAAQALLAADVAARAGASQIALLVHTEQRLRVPEGDYWSGRVDGDSLARVGELVVSLALFGEAAAPGDPVSAKAVHWDPRRAALEIHLLITPTSWQLVSPLGHLATIDTSTQGSEHPRDLLRSELLQLRRAFPDEDGLILVPLGDTSYAAMVAAAEAVRADAQGRALFSQLAMRAESPKVASGGRFRSRVIRRASGTVEVDPDALRGRLPIARRCYLQLLDKNTRPGGTVRLTLAENGSIRSAGRADLGQCAEKAFSGPMLEEQMPAVEVRFSDRAK